MSAIFNPSPPPVETTERATPPPVFAAGPQRWKLWVTLAVVLVVAGAAYLALRGRPQPEAAHAAVRTARVFAGTFERTIRLAGTTTARNFANITAPMMRGPDSGRNLVLIKLAAAGSIVRKGELIAQIDAQPIKDHIDDLDTLVIQADADVKKRKAEQAIEMETLRQTARAAKAALDKARLDNNAAEIRMPIDKEILQLAVAEAEAQYKELQTELVTTAEKQRAEIRVLEYTRDRHARHRDRHMRDLERFTMYAPIGGLVVMQTVWRSGDMGQIQEGDQVYPGQPFMKIVDTNSMQVEASVNQVESEGIRIGQPAHVHFDAFPGLELNGRVHSVGAIGVGGWREQYYMRTIPVVISIEGADKRVIPDLSASGDVMLERRGNVLVAPLDSVIGEHGKNVVYVKQGDRFDEREVEAGARNHTQVEILAGLHAGDEVALGRPAPANP